MSGNRKAESPGREPALGFLLRVAYRLQAADLQRRAAGMAISPNEFLHLYLLHHWGCLSPGEMTRRLDLTKAAATAVLRSLLTKGLVSTAQNGSDSRRLDVRLSIKGRKATGALLKQADKTSRDAMQGFSETESATLMNLLGRIIDNLRPPRGAK